MLNISNFQKNGYVINFKKLPEKNGDFLKLEIDAFYNNEVIPISNPIIIKNAPTLIPDGTFSIKKININGNEQDIVYNNMKYNPEEAISLVILDLVKNTWQH